MEEIYSQEIFPNGDHGTPIVEITKNGLPMSIDDIEDDLHEFESKIKQLQAKYHKLDDSWNEDYERLESERDKLKQAIEFIDNWCKAYPLKIFPEPDMEKAHKILKEHGMTLDAISASNMRHVITRVREELQKAIKEVE